MIDKRLTKVVSKELKIADSEVTADLVINQVHEWDSLGHLNLVLAIENEYKIKFAMKEILELTSIQKIADAVKEKLE